ncbi:MAG: hypothetical protein ACM3Z4_05870 [Hyphomicrobiales bacterium]
MERAVVEGALEAARKDNSRLQSEVAALRSTLRDGAPREDPPVTPTEAANDKTPQKGKRAKGAEGPQLEAGSGLSRSNGWPLMRGAPPRFAFRASARPDNAATPTYMTAMRTLFVVVPLLALLTFSVWFVAVAWERLGGDAIPAYGYVAIAGGVLVSLLVGGGLMALVFYSHRHGYDDLSGGDSDRR